MYLNQWEVMITLYRMWAFADSNIIEFDAVFILQILFVGQNAWFVKKN